jgi:hypothetical protein
MKPLDQGTRIHTIPKTNSINLVWLKQFGYISWLINSVSCFNFRAHPASELRQECITRFLFYMPHLFYELYTMSSDRPYNDSAPFR